MSSHKLTCALGIIILFAVALLLVPPTVDAALTWSRTQADVVFANGEFSFRILPTAQGGPLEKTYAISPDPPTGVSLTVSSGSPRLIGTPTAVMAKTAYTFTASAQGETSITQTFHITVVPAFRWEGPQSDLEWTKGSAINIALSSAWGADEITYDLSPDLPTGVRFLPALGPTIIGGTPSVGMATTAYTFTAAAQGETSLTQTFNITVHSPPEFSSSISPSQQVATVGQRFSLVLPAATHEDGDTTTYTLSGDIPDGLTFTAASRTLAGTPTEATTGVELTYTAVDGGSHSADTDITATFTLVVNSASPAAPTGVSVVSGVGKITVTWTNGSTSGFEYSRDGGAWTAVGTYPLELTGTAGTEIAVRIRVARSGNTPAGTPSAAQRGTPTGTSQQQQPPPPPPPPPPPAPTGVSVAAGVGKITVTWTNGSTSGFEYSRDGDMWTAVATYPLELTGIAGTEIAVHIRVARSGNTPAGTPSATRRGTPLPDPTVPAAPTDVVVEPGPGKITVRWTGGSATGYEYSTDGGANWGAVSAYPLVIRGAAGTPITVRIRVAAAGTTPAGTPSAAVSETPLPTPTVPAALTNLRVGPGPGSITVAWDEGITGYEYSTDAGKTWTDVTAHPLQIPCTPGTTVTVQVRKKRTGDIPVGSISTASAQVGPVGVTAPVFTGLISPMSLTTGVAMPAMTLPTATPANPGDTLTYRISPALPTGLAFTPGTRVLSGTPAVVTATTEYTYTVADQTGATAMLIFTITVVSPPPDPTLPAIANKAFGAGTAVREALPEATSGTDVTYTLTGVLPAGLLFDAGTRVLSGTPTAAMDATQYTYTATNSVGRVSQTFSITVLPVPPVSPLVIPSKGFAVFVHVGATGTDTGISDAVKTIAVTPNKVRGTQQMPDLWDFFRNEGTIIVRGPAGSAAGDLKITEIMTAKDASLGARSKYSQWIEVYNRTGADIDFRDAGWMFDFRQGGVFPLPAAASATDAGRVDLVSNMGNPGYWDIKSTGGRTEAASTVAAVPLVSMYRKLKQFDEDNTGHADHATDDGDPERAGTWVASGRPSKNLSGNRLGTPGTYPEPVLPPKTVLSQEVLINEIGNSSSDANDWVELKNISDKEMNLKKWELNIVMSVDGVAKETQLVSFPDNDNTKLPANGILLLTHSDPTASGNDLAAGVAISKAAAARVQRGVTSLYYTDSKLVLPNSGRYNLILRSANDKEGQPTHIVDHGGTYYAEKKDGSFDTEVWPLQLWAAGHGNVIEGAEEDFRAGLVYKRTGKNTGIGEKHWAKVGFTGIGYDRTAAKTDENGGTPGYANDALKAKVADLSDAEVTISEIMFATGSGRRSLPQWIELYNASLTQGVNLNGWKLEIQNARHENLDARVNATLTLGAVTLAPNQTVLIVATSGSNSGRDHFPETRTIDLWTSHRSDLEMESRTDTVLSPTGFYLKLTDKDKKLVDEVGNTDGNRRTNDMPAWALPMGMNSDKHRASIIRRYDDGMAEDGMMRSGWVSAEKTGRSAEGYTEETYYGDRNDIGTPGHHGGGPLPVSLASFRPARDTATGEVVIRWTTESELNNAGFNILRSETKTGTFTVINGKGIIPGHGTTAEKHAYTWTDTSAKPNVVYYYQIEDVSLDGTRTTLRTTHLRGNVNAAGKLTTTWGDVKTRN